MAGKEVASGCNVVLCMGNCARASVYEQLRMCNCAVHVAQHIPCTEGVLKSALGSRWRAQAAENHAVTRARGATPRPQAGELATSAKREGPELMRAAMGFGVGRERPPNQAPTATAVW